MGREAWAGWSRTRGETGARFAPTSSVPWLCQSSVGMRANYEEPSDGHGSILRAQGEGISGDAAGGDGARCGTRAERRGARCTSTIPPIPDRATSLRASRPNETASDVLKPSEVFMYAKL